MFFYGGIFTIFACYVEFPLFDYMKFLFPYYPKSVFCYFICFVNGKLE
jgi:hypothetical protein